MRAITSTFCKIPVFSIKGEFSSCIFTVLLDLVFAGVRGQRVVQHTGSAGWDAAASSFPPGGEYLKRGRGLVAVTCQFVTQGDETTYRRLQYGRLMNPTFGD